MLISIYSVYRQSWGIIKYSASRYIRNFYEFVIGHTIQHQDYIGKISAFGMSDFCLIVTWLMCYQNRWIICGCIISTVSIYTCTHSQSFSLRCCPEFHAQKTKNSLVHGPTMLGYTTHVGSVFCCLLVLFLSHLSQSAIYTVWLCRLARTVSVPGLTSL